MSERPPQHKNYGLVDQNQALLESPLVDQHQLKESKYYWPRIGILGHSLLTSFTFKKA